MPRGISSWVQNPADAKGLYHWQVSEKAAGQSAFAVVDDIAGARDITGRRWRGEYLCLGHDEHHDDRQGKSDHDDAPGGSQVHSRRRRVYRQSFIRAALPRTRHCRTWRWSTVALRRVSTSWTTITAGGT